MDALPPELLSMITDNMDFQSLLKLSYTNQHLNEHVNANWFRLHQKHQIDGVPSQIVHQIAQFLDCKSAVQLSYANKRIHNTIDKNRRSLQRFQFHDVSFYGCEDSSLGLQFFRSSLYDRSEEYYRAVQDENYMLNGRTKCFRLQLADDGESSTATLDSLTSFFKRDWKHSQHTLNEYQDRRYEVPDFDKTFTVTEEVLHSFLGWIFERCKTLKFLALEVDTLWLHIIQSALVRTRTQCNSVFDVVLKENSPSTSQEDDMHVCAKLFSNLESQRSTRIVFSVPKTVTPNVVKKELIDNIEWKTISLIGLDRVICRNILRFELQRYEKIDGKYVMRRMEIFDDDDWLWIL